MNRWEYSGDPKYYMHSYFVFAPSWRTKFDINENKMVVDENWNIDNHIDIDWDCRKVLSAIHSACIELYKTGELHITDSDMATSLLVALDQYASVGQDLSRHLWRGLDKAHPTPYYSGWQ